MADSKITGLVELTTPETGDIFAIVDSPGVTPVTKKITIDNLDLSLMDNTTSLFPVNSQTFYIGTTEVAINRASATLNLAGIGTLACGAITSSGALTATSYGGITEANLLDKTASVTITGAEWQFVRIGIGTGAGSTRRVIISPDDKTVDSNAANYLIGMTVDSWAADIASGVTDSGYRINVRTDAFIGDADFEGTLTELTSFATRYGINVGTGIVTRAKGLSIQRLSTTGTITNAYDVYIAAPSTGGTVTNEYCIYSANDAPSYFTGAITAASYTDNTPAYEGNALEAINNIRGTNGKIDHDSLPTFAQKEIKKSIYEDKKDEDGKEIKDEKGEIEKEYVGTEITKGRDLGAMISILTKAVQELSAEVELLKKWKE